MREILIVRMEKSDLFSQQTFNSPNLRYETFESHALKNKSTSSFEKPQTIEGTLVSILCITKWTDMNENMTEFGCP